MAGRLYLSFVSFTNVEDPWQLSQCEEKMERLITAKKLFDVRWNRHCAKHTFQVLQMQCPSWSNKSFHSHEMKKKKSYTLVHWYSSNTFNVCRRNFSIQTESFWFMMHIFRSKSSSHSLNLDLTLQLYLMVVQSLQTTHRSVISFLQ